MFLLFFPLQYLRDVNCPFKIQERQEAIDWLLGLAVRLEYGDNGMFCGERECGCGLVGLLKRFLFLGVCVSKHTWCLWRPEKESRASGARV